MLAGGWRRPGASVRRSWRYFRAPVTDVPRDGRRTRGHVEAFRGLYAEVTRGGIDEAALAEVERRDAIFEEMDYTVYA